MNIYICNICNRDFKSKRSLTCHTNWHNSDYASRCKSYTNKRIKQIENIKQQSIIERNQKIQKYLENPIHCQQCSKIIDYHKIKNRNKFCSRSCAGKYNNAARLAAGWAHHEHSKKKTSISLRHTALHKRVEKLGTEYDFVTVKFLNCEICSSSYVWSNHKAYASKRFCSKHCQNKHASFKMSKWLSNPNNRKNYGRRSPSYLEKSFKEWLDNNYNNTYVQEHHVVRYDSNGRFLKNYFIDFYFPMQQVGIELDGTQHRHTVELDSDRDNYLKSIGIEIVRITYKEYYNKSKLDLICKILGI